MEMIDVYLEIGDKKVFAAAVDWPGWCRSGRDEDEALRRLLAYAPRYKKALALEKIAFQAPDDLSAFKVVERLEGNMTTNFGSPGIAPSADSRPVSDSQLEALQNILRACWHAFDRAAAAAAGKDLVKGPRGGGRDLEAITQHVMGALEGYLSRLDRKSTPADGEDEKAARVRLRQAALDALADAAHGKVAPVGPRGGAHWTPRYFTRREAWHVLDHTWEIEDREP